MGNKAQISQKTGGVRRLSFEHFYERWILVPFVELKQIRHLVRLKMA